LENPEYKTEGEKSLTSKLSHPSRRKHTQANIQVSLTQGVEGKVFYKRPTHSPIDSPKTIENQANTVA
jgi:hypothetical protein